MKWNVMRLMFLLVVLLTAPSLARASEKIVADFGGLSGFQSAVWVAKDLGLFDKLGLDVDLVMITGGSRSVAAFVKRRTLRRENQLKTWSGATVGL
jgi:ABC-type nitrate/sulfonate/bicarbonate transport system substrate-binding protein